MLQITKEVLRMAGRFIVIDNIKENETDKETLFRRQTFYKPVFWR
jgi:hypothetical protein